MFWLASLAQVSAVKASILRSQLLVVILYMHQLSHFYKRTLNFASDALQAFDKQEMASSSGATARQLVQQEFRVESSQTYGYLLKTTAQASGRSRCRSIVEVKRL